MTSIRKYQLKNLNCPNCADRIEQGLEELPGVNFANVNFATSTLHVDAENLSVVADTVGRIEPGVELVFDSQPSIEMDQKSQREVILLGVAILLLGLGLIYEPVLHATPYRLGEYLIFGAAYLFSGTDVILRAAKNISQKNWFDETFMMSISTLGAIIIDEFPEAVVVMLFYRIGEYVQKRSVNRSRGSIRALLDVRPSQANLKIKGELQPVPSEEVNVGEIIVVRPGEKVPLDGIVLEGQSQLDTSTLTGESIPVVVKPGDEVFAGTINQTGLITIEVTKPFDLSSVSKMLELVQNAAARKARTQRFITRFAKVYSPVMVAVAIGVALLPPLFISGATFSTWIYRALVLLVVSCPCALVISIPLGYFGGIGGASRRGILVKGANFLDVLADVKTVVFDKTGTLTRGVFKVTDIVPLNGWNEGDLLKIAAQAESQSNHPVAHSIQQAYGEDHQLEDLDSFEEVVGYGIRAKVNGNLVIAGNDSFMHQEGIDHLTCDVAGTVVHVAVDGEYAGYLVVSDELKSDAKRSIQRLHKIGIDEVVMLSGDRKDVAEKVSRQLGLDHFHAELLPEDKVSVMEEMLQEPHSGRIAFVGDGINDAPALGRADVGIAMGAFGADAAIETADVVLMTESPMKVVQAIEHGRRTRKIVWQNIYMALGIKAIFILLGTFGIASMWEAVFADVGVTLIAVLNATRVLK